MSYVCSICKQEYKNKMFADACEKNHNTIYIELTREELFKLLQFLYTNDRSLITPEFIKKLSKYNKGSYV